MDDSSNPLIEGELDDTDKDGFSLIDGSELDDLFVSMSGSSLGDNKANLVDGGVNMLERPEAEKPRKNEKYNLRKSLAWDSAFFTSAGVLDAEELSSIMEGGNGGKQQLQHLPGIQEDISKSTDSLSTLDSDNLTLESLEADLFSDIRASIQRSGESSKLRKSNLNGRLEETSQLGKKTTEIKLGNMVKPKSTPKKLNTNLQGDGKLMKLGPSREQVKKPVGSRREPSSSLLKPAAASGKGSSMMIAPAKAPAKRMSISAGRTKSDNSNVGNEMGRVTTVSKGDRAGGSRSIIPRVASYAKSSSVSSTTTRTGISSTRSSYDSTSSSSSQSSRILPLNGMQGKTNKPASIIPPGVKSRTPSRVPLKGKNPPSTHRIPGKLSASMLSPSVSPTSSISEWSSCSSTVTANQEHSALKDFSSLHRTYSLDSNASQDMQMHPNQQASCGDEIEAGVPYISAQELSAGNASVSNPVSAKPSGLRMPSPKIGFFDGVKPGGRTQNAVGSMQSRSRLSSSRLPKSTTGSSSPCGVPNKGRIGHATVKPTALAAQNTNSGTRKSNARMAATGGGHLEGISTAEKESNVTASEDVTKTTSLNTNEENNPAAAKLPVGEEHHFESGSNARKKSVLVCPSKNATPQGKSHFQGNQASSSVEADHHIKEMNDDDAIELNTLLLHELINGDTVNTEPHPTNISEEVGDAIEVDKNADTVVQCGESEATKEKNDPICTVTNMSEEAGNAIKVDENADTWVQSRICEATDEKNGPLCAVINMSEEVGNANTADENADTVVLSGGCEAAIEKNDPLCTVINMSEEVGNAISTDETANLKNDPNSAVINMSEVGNAIKVNEIADTVVLSGGCEATNKNNPVCAVITDEQNVSADQQSVEAVGNKRDGNASSVGDSQSPALSCTMELSGLNQEGDAADLPKKTDLCVSSKILESKPCPRTPFADKNSSPDAFSVEVLVKSFTSLSLDNIQAKDVETGMA